MLGRSLRRGWILLGFGSTVHYAWFTLGVGAIVSGVGSTLLAAWLDLPWWALASTFVGLLLLAAGLTGIVIQAAAPFLESHGIRIGAREAEAISGLREQNADLTSERDAAVNSEAESTAEWQAKVVALEARLDDREQRRAANAAINTVISSGSDLRRRMERMGAQADQEVWKQQMNDWYAVAREAVRTHRADRLPSFERPTIGPRLAFEGVPMWASQMIQTLDELGERLHEMVD